MFGAPQSTLTGEEYLEIFGFGGTSSTYVNDTISTASFTPNFYQNFLDTFYLYITASPYIGTPTPEFNITLNFEAYEVPLFEPSNTFAVNQTVGPFYKAFALPVISGQEYEINAWASDYNTSGVAGLFIAPSPQFYLDWQWTSFPGIYETTPEGMIPIQVTNVNDTAGVRFVAVQTTTLYIGVMSQSMSGPPPSDTEEITVTMQETPPAPYALGLTVTEDLTDTKFQSYSVSVAAGTSYRLSLSLDAGGNYAFCSVFNGLGFTPFDATVITLWVQADSGFLNTSITYQAIFSGPVTIILLSDGTASFALVPVGEAPGSFMLGLMIGIIFMIAGVIIVYVLMRRRF
jgi:hypothetical protein